MLYTVSNCSRRERGKREEDKYPTTTSTINNCFLLCHLLPNQYNSSFPHPPSLCYICHSPIFPTVMPLSLLVHSLKFIQALKFPTTLQEMSHILSYSAITHYTPLITNHSTSLLILQWQSWTSPKSDSHTPLTLFRPDISLLPRKVFWQPITFQWSFHIYIFFPVLQISFPSLFFTSKTTLIVQFKPFP